MKKIIIATLLLSATAYAEPSELGSTNGELGGAGPGNAAGTNEAAGVSSNQESTSQYGSPSNGGTAVKPCYTVKECNPFDTTNGQ